jgi:hypothetical protein
LNFVKGIRFGEYVSITKNNKEGVTMSKIRFIHLALIVALGLCTFGTILAQPGPAPILTLTVTPSPDQRDVMIYTAHLSYMPPTPGVKPHVDFYNITDESAVPVYLGSAPFDVTLTAVFKKEMKAGKYVGVAKTDINNVAIWSNKVPYIVP